VVKEKVIDFLNPFHNNNNSLIIEFYFYPVRV